MGLLFNMFLGSLLGVCLFFFKYDQGETTTIIEKQFLSKEEIFKKFTREELLTSDKVYLRKLGLEYV